MRRCAALFAFMVLGTSLSLANYETDEATKKLIHWIIEDMNLSIELALKENPVKINFSYANPNSHDTVLHAATRKGRVDLVREFIKLGAPIDLARPGSGATPLHVAAGLPSIGNADKNLDLLDLLLSLGAKPDATDNVGNTPLHVAALNERPLILCALVLAGGNPMLVNSSGQTPVEIYRSLRRGQTLSPRRPMSVAITPRGRPETRRLSSYTSFERAASGELPQWPLAESSLTTFADGLTLLHMAIIHAQDASFNWIVDPNRRHKVDLQLATRTQGLGEAPVHTAAQAGNFPVHLAAQYGTESMMRYLLDHGVNPTVTNNLGRTPLMTASITPNRGTFVRLLVASLLTAGLSLDDKDNDGMTALHHAIARKNTEAFEALLSGGAGVELATREGFYPIHLIAAHGTVEMMQRLLRLKVNVDIRGPLRETALMIAAHYARTDMVELLLSYGAQINEVDRDGFSALLRSSERGDIITCAYLLRRGANRFLRNQRGKDFREIASSAGHPEVGAIFARLVPLEFVDVVKHGELSEVVQALEAAPDRDALARQTDTEGNNVLQIALQRANRGPVRPSVERSRTLLELQTLFQRVNTETRGFLATNANQDGETAVHRAVTLDRPDILTQLGIQTGYRILVAQEQLMTPLMAAAREGRRQVLHQLLMQEFDPRRVNPAGLTALHFAAIGGHREIIIDLIRAGADPCARDHLGRTAYSLLEHHARDSEVHQALVRDIVPFLMRVCPREPLLRHEDPEQPSTPAKERGVLSSLRARVRSMGSSDEIQPFGQAAESPNELGSTLRRRTQIRTQSLEGVEAQRSAADAATIEAEPLPRSSSSAPSSASSSPTGQSLVDWREFLRRTSLISAGAAASTKPNDSKQENKGRGTLRGLLHRTGSHDADEVRQDHALRQSILISLEERERVEHVRRELIEQANAENPNAWVLSVLHPDLWRYLGSAFIILLADIQGGSLRGSRLSP